MNKKTEYKEPEFKAVISKNADVLTTSLEGNLGRVTDDWEDEDFAFSL
ncbi:MAG: hypothetical protein IJR70_04325 [Eubacterium sp.]|nr:hypothetical protein [Eubacterium sp.]